MALLVAVCVLNFVVIRKYHSKSSASGGYARSGPSVSFSPAEPSIQALREHAKVLEMTAADAASQNIAFVNSTFTASWLELTGLIMDAYAFALGQRLQDEMRAALLAIGPSTAQNPARLAESTECRDNKDPQIGCLIMC